MEKPYKVDLGLVKKKILSKYQTPGASMQFFRKKHVQEFFGVMNISDNAFSLRKEDATASVAVTKELKTNDFGTQDGQKEIDVLIFEALFKDKPHILEKGKQAKHFPIIVNKLAELDGEDVNQDLSNWVPEEVTEKKTEKAKPYTEKYILGRIANAKRNSKKFDTIIKGLCRSCSEEEINKAVEIFNIGLVDYFPKVKEGEKPPKNPKKIFRAFIPEYDARDVPYGSFSYNRSITDKKGLLRTNGKRVLFGENLLKNYNRSKPVIFSEGHSDTVVNVAKGMQCITSGSAGMGIGSNIVELKGLTLHFYPDLDLPGVEGLTKKLLEIEIFNSTAKEEDMIKYQVFYWSTDIIINDEVIDFRLYEKNQGALIKSFMTKDKRPFSTYLKELSPEAKQALWSKIKLSSWKPKSRTPRQKGYDWIDFHTDNQHHEKYTKFKETYTY